MRYAKVISLQFFLLLSICNIHPTEIGSESLSSVETHCTFLSAHGDNAMLGFGWFKNGFELEDQATTCDFSSVFPVSGDIDLHGGTLRLYSDLVLRNPTTWTGAGRIIGGGIYVFDICSSVESLGTTEVAHLFQDLTVELHDDLVISGGVIFKGDCVLDGHGKRLVLGGDGYIRMNAGVSVTFKDVQIENIHAGNFFCVDDSASIILDGVTWIQDGNYLFNRGSLTFKDKNVFLGRYRFTYESKHTSTIASCSQWIISDGMQVDIGRKEAVDYVEPVYFEDASSTWQLNNCILVVTGSGMRLAGGAAEVNGDIILDINSTDSNNGLILGDGAPAADVGLTLYPGAAMRLVNGHLVLDGANTEVFGSKKNNARLIGDAGTVVFVNQDLALKNLIIASDSYDVIDTAADKIVTYENCLMETDFADFVLTGERGTDTINYLVGGDDLFLIKGDLTTDTYIWGNNNKIRGHGSISGSIELQNSSARVRFGLNGVLFNDVTMNDGVVILDKDLHMARDKKFLGSGIVFLADKEIHIGGDEWLDSTYWDSNRGEVHLHSKTLLSGTWTFSGRCTLDGHGNVLDLTYGGDIVVERGSSLEIKNIFIKGVSGNRIRCLDADSKIQLSFVSCVLDGNYSFTIGALSFKDENAFCGNHTFAYQSAQTSTVQPCSQLTFQHGITFSFDPIYNANISNWDNARNFLEFGNETSIIKLKGTTIHVTSTSLKLKKGTLKVEDRSYIVSELDGDFHIEEGLIIGNNNFSDDMRCVIGGGAILEVSSGALSYKNVESSSWSMLSNSSILHIASGGKLKLHQTLDVGEGIASFAGGSRLARAWGKQLLGSVSVFGAVYYEVCYN